ncbi:MAG TPA: hypothetical protein VF006_18045 [Longimicrobium sp.]
MTDLLDPAIPNTTESSATVAQNRGVDAPYLNGGGNGNGGGDGSGGGEDGRRPPRCVPGEHFIIGDGVGRGARGLPYERKPGDPLYRPLRIYTLDPGTSSADGATAIVNVPYEPLKNGLTGHVFRVLPVDRDPANGADLDDPFILMSSGYTPSPADPRFHQQMVYAVSSLLYASFRRALGRHVAWGFDSQNPRDTRRTRLALRPHGGSHPGATYNRRKGEVSFGFFEASEEVTGRIAPRARVFSCVSHDIVTHEVTHALLDGLRAHFSDPTSADVLGFHEGFADLIAILQHFSYPEVVKAAVRRSRGALSQAELITSLATQFGHAIGNGAPLRTAVALVQEADQGGEAKQEPRIYHPTLDAHEMGQVFISAVFDAFITVYTRKTERYVRLATGGTGVLPEGEIPADLQSVLAEEASQLASQFLNVAIRAIDYCPPVDLQLGEFLRAVITADLDLVPHDPWGYREAWIDAFARHGIYPPGVRSLAEEDLRWLPPEQKLKPVKHLSFKRLRFEGDPARPAGTRELRRQACALAAVVVENPEAFGLARPGHKDLDGDEVGLPEVHSVRASRRVGPDGQVVFDLVAEVTQLRRVDEHKIFFRGGATVILDPHGEVRYVIAKSVLQNGRVFRQNRFMKGAGSAHFSASDGWQAADPETLDRVHPNRAAGG